MQTDRLTLLADRFGSDKGSTVLCAHGYTRIYDAALSPVREKPLRLLEIGLIHGHTQNVSHDRLGEIGCPSLRMWAEYLPAASLFGFDIMDFRALAEPRMTIFQGDQGIRQHLVDMTEQAGGAFDIIIDDGSHASHHQQTSLAVLFQYLAPGGLYCIEDLHYQPEELEVMGISPTKEFLRDLRFGRTGSRVALEQHDLALLQRQIQAIHFFDSQSDRWPLSQQEDALAIIIKQGAHPLLGNIAGRLPPP